MYAHNDEMALGAIKAIKAAGRQNEMIVIGIDGQNEAIDAIQAGDLAATFVYDYCAPEGMIAAKASTKASLSSRTCCSDTPRSTRPTSRSGSVKATRWLVCEIRYNLAVSVVTPGLASKGLPDEPLSLYFVVENRGDGPVPIPSFYARHGCLSGGDSPLRRIDRTNR